MQHRMSSEPQPHRVLLNHAPAEAFAPLTLSMLAKLGYAIVSETEFAERCDLERPALRIVDERSLAEVPEGAGSTLPIVVLTGRHGVTGVDPRIVGAVRRPALAIAQGQPSDEASQTGSAAPAASRRFMPGSPCSSSSSWSTLAIVASTGKSSFV